ncbi:MAG TPA: MBL fold metallo-hydrolase, partial [Candidatus Methylomirabilis sp.]|nr:MBL fold metallo-hydrolase [Candidatus Methylomirabilis sp.]
GHFSSLDEQNADGIFSASLDDLKLSNDGLLMLQSETEDGFVRYLLDSLPPFVPEYVDIKRVNTGLLKPIEEDAWALELGKNACGLSQVRQPVAGAIP